MGLLNDTQARLSAADEAIAELLEERRRLHAAMTFALEEGYVGRVVRLQKQFDQKTKDYNDLLRERAEWNRVVAADVPARRGTPKAGSLKAGSLHRPPGARLLAFAEFVYSRKTYESILRPTVMDLQDEYFEALATGRPGKARWIRVRGYWSFFAAAGLFSLLALARKLLSLWRVV